MNEWEALKKILASPQHRKAIGRGAWQLFFYLILHVDEKGVLVTNYKDLEKQMRIPIPTLKSWRKSLVRNGVIQSFTRDGMLVFYVLQPFNQIVSMSGGQYVGSILELSGITERLADLERLVQNRNLK